MIRRFFVTMGVTFTCLCTVSLAQDAQISGVITDQQKNPVPDAQVIVVPDQPRYWTKEEMTPLAAASADTRGEFRIDVPTTGAVALIAWGPAHRMTKYKINPERASSVKIGMALDPGNIVTGTVVDRADNKPVAGATVGPLVAGLDTETQRSLRVVPQWTTTDDSGKFSFQGVATDIAHQFIVHADDYMITNVELDPGKVDAGIVMDKGGFGVTGEVYARIARPGAFANTVVRANGNGFDVIRRADAEGRFSIKGLPGGTFSVEPLLIDTDRAAAVEVVEMPDDNNTSIALEVSSGYYIRGTAIDVETSTPASHVPVGLNDHWSTSSSTGAFALGPFYQGQQLAIQVPEENGWRLEELVAINEYNATDGFNDINNVTVRVRRQRLLDISLANFEQTTQPVTVTVLSEKDAIRRQVTSSTVEIPVFNAGSYSIFAVAGGMATGLETVSVGQQEHMPIALSFAPVTSAAGRVTLVNTDETTRVRTFVISMHTAANGQPGPQLFTGTSPRDDGSFTFNGMPHGDFVLVVANQSGTRKTSSAITLAAGPNVLPDISWEAGNRVSGKIVNPQGEPVPFARVTLMPAGGESLRLEAGEDGGFKAEDLEAEKLDSLVVESAAFATWREQDVALPADDKIVTMQPMGRLVIHVEAAQTSSWDVHVVRMSPWSVGAYASQLVGQSIFTREVIGGEALETGIGEEGKFRAVAVNKSSGELMVGELFDWAGERAKGQTVYLRSTATGTISGSVGDSSQAVEVTAINTAVPESEGMEKAEFQVAASNGKYQLTGLPAGNYLLLGVGEASSSYALNVDLAPGGSATADLEVVPLATVAGIVELGGEPVAGAPVRLVSETEAGSEPKSTTTGEDGRFAFDGLTPDAYSVSTEFSSDDENISAASSIAVKAGEQPAPVRLDLTPPQPVLFQVDAGVKLPADTPVQMMNLQSRQLIQASWTSEGLEAQAAPGRYEVWSGDAVVGVAEVAENGTGTVRPQ